MSELLGNKETKKEQVKELINRLHQGEDPEAVKEEFKDVIKGLSPLQIAKIEGEMIREGMPREEIHDLCDVHLAAMKDAIEGTAPQVPEWHPIRVLLGEHREFLKGAIRLRGHAKAIKEAVDSGADLEPVKERMQDIQNIVGGFKHEELHYQREENVLFSYLEKHGVTEPPAIMWMDHDRIRTVKKTIRKLVEGAHDLDPSEIPAFANTFHETALGYHEMVSSHFYKENNILFPSSVNVIEEAEWIDIGNQFDDIGYFFIQPAGERPKEGGDAADVPTGYGVELKAAIGSIQDSVNMETGNFTIPQLEAMLNTLPVEITFVDKDNKVRFFNKSKDRIFIRSKAVIGRDVHNCHPNKSIHVVEKIVKSFVEGRKDHADFWLTLDGKMIYIRFFAVRSPEGEYLGAVEVTQDITEIQKIIGKQLLADIE